MSDLSAFNVEKEEPNGSSAPLQFLRNAIQEAGNLDEQIANMEEDLKALKGQRNALLQDRIPNLMMQLQMPKPTHDGYEVKVDDFVGGGLPKEDPAKRAAAIQWLKDHGAEDLFKTDLVVNFARTQHNEAMDLAQTLREQGFTPDVQEGVHTQTLWAWARERIRNGEALEPEKIGLMVGKVAKIKKVKAK